MKVGAFAKRERGECAVPSEWNTRKLPEPTVVSAFATIADKEEFREMCQSERRRLGVGGVSSALAVANATRTTGHASWGVRVNATDQLPANLAEYSNKWWGLFSGAEFPDSIKDHPKYSPYRLLLSFLNDNDTAFNLMFRFGVIQADSQRARWYNFRIAPEKLVAAVQHIKTLKETSETNPQPFSAHYVIFEHNCTDACVQAMQAAGINAPNVRVKIGVICGANERWDYPFAAISSPAALADYFLTLPPHP